MADDREPWFHDVHGNLVVVQAPNLPILVWLGAVVLRTLVHGGAPERLADASGSAHSSPGRTSRWRRAAPESGGSSAPWCSSPWSSDASGAESAAVDADPGPSTPIPGRRCRSRADYGPTTATRPSAAAVTSDSGERITTAAHASAPSTRVWVQFRTTIS